MKRFLILLFAALSLSPALRAEAEPEIRAFWIEAWSNGIKTPAQVNQLIADAQAGNFNTIIPQVRRRGDAFYQSNIEPRANDSAVPVGYDPLADLIAKAHAANPPIEVHAWIVVYPIWRVGNSPHPDPNHVFNKHPEWLTVSHTGEPHDGENHQVDPGHPEVQQHTFDVAMDLLTNYAIDGLHYDYVRYSGRSWGYNPVAIERFNRIQGRTGIPAPTDPEWMQFRRDQVTQLVRKIYLSAIEIRPDLKVSAATITWAPGPANLSQWYSSSAAYQHVLQDWRGWMEEGILDLNFPMAYFREQTHRQDWLNWINFAKDHRYDRHVVMGPGIWLNSIAETIRQFRDTRDPSPAGNYGQGVSGYSYQGTNNQGLPRSSLLHALVYPSQHDNESPVFAEPASVPEMPWKTDPQTGHLKGFVRNVADMTGIDGAIVQISGTETRTIQTDATGFYGFVDLPPGEYAITVSWFEEPGTNPTSTITIDKGEVAHQDLFFGEAAPEILEQPESLELMAGTTAVLSVNAIGAPSPTYQWQLNGIDIPEATNPELVFDTVNVSDRGEYRVRVTNSLGTVVSEVAELTVYPSFPHPTIANPRIDSVHGFRGTLLAPEEAWYLLETSIDLQAWEPLKTMEFNQIPLPFSHADWATGDRRFYRARQVPVFPLADFELYANGTPILFNSPSFSGSTSSHIATGSGIPNFARLTQTFPAGSNANQLLHVAWSFATDSPSTWLRLTTYNAPVIPNPIIDLSHGLRLNIYVDRPIYLALGVRETGTTGAIGANGGISGAIEWVGGRTDNSSSPPKGIYIPAGEWVAVDFFLPLEPVRSHSGGNGILESPTGFGVLENLTIVPADGLGVYNLYLDSPLGIGYQ